MARAPAWDPAEMPPWAASRDVSSLPTCCGKTWPRRRLVTISGNLRRSHHPRIRAACYTTDSSTSPGCRNPLFDSTGSGVVARGERWHPEVLLLVLRRPQKHPEARTSSTNQLPKTRALRSSKSHLSPSSLVELLEANVASIGKDQIHCLNLGVGQSATTNPSCSENKTPFPPSYAAIQYVHRGGHNPKSRLQTSKSPSLPQSGWPSTKNKQDPRTLSLEWRRWKANQKRGNALAWSLPLSQSFQRLRPAPTVTNGQHKLRCVSTRTFLDVQGRIHPSMGIRRNTPQTSRLSSHTSVHSPENYADNPHRCPPMVPT